jgi:glycosyltransferase involved in cell wall biosynthesis
MWSRRGFPVVVPLVLKLLKFRGCRTAIVFHDVYAVPDSRWIDRFRVYLQERIMRYLSLHSCRAVITVPADAASWLPIQKRSIQFIPVGANIPSYDDLAHEGVAPVRHPHPTVAVFGVATWPAAQRREVDAIVQAACKTAAQTGDLRLLVLGRGAKEAEPLLRAGLSGTRVRLQVDGLRSGREISIRLLCCDVLLFVRGALSTRRGSGLAALACGLPIVAYQGRETSFPLTEAGIVFVPQDDQDSLGKALARVLLDRELRHRLTERNLDVFREWFSWDRIAGDWIKTFGAQELASWKPTRSPRKLVIYSADFWPSVGGVQSAVMALAQGFASRERVRCDECTVVTDTAAGRASDSQLPFRVVRKPNFMQLVRLLWGSDLIHLAGPALLPLMLSYVFRKKVVVEHHGFHALCPNGLLFHEPSRTACPGHFLAGLHRECWKCNAESGRWRSLMLWALTFLRRWSCRLVTANIVPTRWLGQLVQLPQTFVVPHGVAERPLAPLPLAKSSKFAFIGRLVSTKGVDLLLRASAELLRRGIQCSVVIIGDGPERKNLELLCNELRLAPAVDFVGQVEEKDVAALLSDAVAIIIPSPAGEVFGLVAAESMMRGRPVIVPDAGPLAEVAGDTGLKFAPGDATSLADCMERFLHSPEVATELGERARRRSLDNFRADQMLDGHLALYQGVLK